LNNRRVNLYRADRILNLEEGDTCEFQLPSLQDWLKERDLIPSEDTCELVIRISRNIARNYSNPFFNFSTTTWDDEKSGTLRQIVSKREFPYIVSLITSFGAEAEILKPPELRERLILNLKNTLALYEKL
jgi:predicted DNA-binding transcriptional regulator YafY